MPSRLIHVFSIPSGVSFPSSARDGEKVLRKRRLDSALLNCGGRSRTGLISSRGLRTEKCQQLLSRDTSGAHPRRPVSTHGSYPDCVDTFGICIKKSMSGCVFADLGSLDSARALSCSISGNSVWVNVLARFHGCTKGRTLQVLGTRAMFFVSVQDGMICQHGIGWKIRAR